MSSSSNVRLHSCCFCCLCDSGTLMVAGHLFENASWSILRVAMSDDGRASNHSWAMFSMSSYSLKCSIHCPLFQPVGRSKRKVENQCAGSMASLSSPWSRGRGATMSDIMLLGGVEWLRVGVVGFWEFGSLGCQVFYVCWMVWTWLAWGGTVVMGLLLYCC